MTMIRMTLIAEHSAHLSGRLIYSVVAAAEPIAGGSGRMAIVRAAVERTTASTGMPHELARLVAISTSPKAVRDIKVDGSPLTHEAVRLRAQLPPAAVWRWPAVYDEFREISSDAQQTWNGQLAQQDELLVAKVRHVIQ